MGTIFMIHRLFGGMILPLLLLGAAIWFTVSWKPERWPGRPARLFHILVDVQFLLGLSYWIYLRHARCAHARFVRRKESLMVDLQR